MSRLTFVTTVEPRLSVFLPTVCCLYMQSVELFVKIGLPICHELLEMPTILTSYPEASSIVYLPAILLLTLWL